MRAAYSAGALQPLIHYGFNSAFDHVIGSSAGAINGAYFLSGDGDIRYTYTDDITNKNFVNLLRRDKKVDIDYLVDLVLKHKRPISTRELLRAHSKLHIIMTDAETGEKVVISSHHLYNDIYDEFRATAALPLPYDKKITLGGRTFIDGGVSDLLPVDVAVKLGCTDIVVVMTKRIADYRFDNSHDRLVKHLVKHFGKSQPLSIQQKLPTDARMLQANLRRMTHPTKKIRFYVLQPSNPEALVSLATTDKSKIAELAALGLTDMDAFLQAPITA